MVMVACKGSTRSQDLPILVVAEGDDARVHENLDMLLACFPPGAFHS